MKRKGFTLIELLGVIVVLAVIAIITTPVILGVIEKSRKSSYKASMYGIINAADIYLTENLGKVSKNEEIVFTCDGVKCSNSEGYKLSFKGEVPKSGSIYIKGNGSISKILISQNELISNLNNIITSNQNSVSNLTNQLNMINTKLDSKANTSHTHDDRYYTESETNNLLGKYFQGSIIVRMISSTLALTAKETTYTVPLNNATWNYGAANTLSVGSDGTITIKKPGYYYISGAVQLTSGSDNANVIAKVILKNGSSLIQMTLRKNGTASESVALPGVLVHIGEANTVRLQVTDYSGTSTTIVQPTFLNVTCVKLD